MALPTKKIPELTAYGAALQGTEMFEIWAVNTSRRVTARDFVLPMDSVLTVTPLGVVGSNSRQLTAGIGIAFVDGGAGGTFEVNATGAVAGPANPTASVGLAAVNGVAVTYMRSDAAPPVSQAIVPTWTGLHTFAASLIVTANDPFLRLSESDAAANNRVWDFTAVGEQLRGRVGDDAQAVFANWLEVDRTLNVIDVVNLLGTAVQANGSPILTVATAFANPTGTIGLAAVNGVAVTALRSDAAPALSQAIAPTWTAQHIFGLSGAANAAILVSSAQPQVDWNETDAAANNRRWRQGVQGEQFLFQTVDDANAATVTWLAVDRTLNVVDTLALTSTALTWNGNALLSTATAFANPTGTIGLAAVNGVATTALRSDAAPALSQAIAPTWTAQHIFGLSGATNAAILVSSVQPQIDWNETDGAANNRRWRFGPQGEQFLGQVVDDANSAAVSWVTVDRTANVVDSIALLSNLTRVGSQAYVTVATDGVLVISSNQPNLYLYEADGAANNRAWRMMASAEDLIFQVRSDDDASGNTWQVVSRTGTTVDQIGFPLGIVRVGANQTEAFALSPSLRVANDGTAGLGLRDCSNNIEGFIIASSTSVQFGSATAHPIQVYTANTLRFSFTDAATNTGAATPTLSANKPGSNAGVATWIPITSAGGAQLWVPAFANA